MCRRFKQVRLADFIERTFVEIVDGIRAAQEYAAQNGAAINPQNVNWSEKKQGFYICAKDHAEEAPLLTQVDFDVLVTASRDTGLQPEIGVFAGVLNVGAKGRAGRRSETAHRIKFHVLAELPQQQPPPSSVEAGQSAVA